MKFQVFLVLALIALALAKKDKAKKDKAKEPKPKVIEAIADKPQDIKVGKLFVMDWESTYGRNPVVILRSFKLGDMSSLYDRGFYPGHYQYPRIIGSTYRRLIFDPEQYYNRFGYHPSA